VLISVFTPSHDPRFLGDAYESLVRQSLPEWEWIVLLNKGAQWRPPREDPRVRISRASSRLRGIGALKRAACELASGDILVELDHDDVLTRGCLAAVADAGLTLEDIDGLSTYPGPGGVGMSAVMGAVVAGAASIVAVDPVAFKREQALKFGATHTAPSVAEAQPLVSELTRNRMADSAIITVGVLHGDLIGPVSRLVGKGGNVVVTSVAPMTEDTVALPLVEFAMSAKNLVGVVMGLTRPLVDIDQIYALYRAGRLPLDDLVTRTYKLDDINTGYADMHRGVNLRGVIAF